MFGLAKRTRRLRSYTEDHLRAVDDDIVDLHARLLDGLEIGINQVLMSKHPPVSLLKIGPVVDRVVIQGHKADVYEITATSGPLYAFDVDTAVAVTASQQPEPDGDVVGLISRKAITRAQEAAERYPVALALFLLLAEVGLENRMLSVCHFESGETGGRDRSLEDPGVFKALVKSVGAREARRQRNEARENSRARPVEYFVMTFEGADGLTAAKFTEERVYLMPMSGADTVLDKIPMIPMKELEHEADALAARLRRRC